MSMRSSEPSPPVRRALGLALVLSMASLVAAACTGELDQGSYLRSDVGGDEAADASTNLEDADPTSPPTADGGGGEAGTGTDTHDAGGQPDSGGGGGGGGSDAGTPQGCADGDGACPSGCYVIDDSDCPLDCRDPSTWPPAWVAFEDEVLVLTNQMRESDQSCGGQPYPAQPPLTMNAQLREAARCHSLDMAERDYFSHFSPEGESPVERITEAGYAWADLGENVAAGPPRPDVVVPGWMNSPPHCTGIMTAELTEIGVGYAFDVFADPDPLNDWKHYWTQAFGLPR